MKPTNMLLLASVILFILDIIKPQQNLFWYKGDRTKNKSLYIYSLATVNSIVSTYYYYSCAIEVEYNNPTADKQLNSNPFDWSASDNENYFYEYDVMMAKEPILDGKTLNPGGKVKGWLTFKIPKTNQLTKVFPRKSIHNPGCV